MAHRRNRGRRRARAHRAAGVLRAQRHKAAREQQTAAFVARVLGESWKPQITYRDHVQRVDVPAHEPIGAPAGMQLEDVAALVRELQRFRRQWENAVDVARKNHLDAIGQHAHAMEQLRQTMRPVLDKLAHLRIGETSPQRVAMLGPVNRFLPGVPDVSVAVSHVETVDTHRNYRLEIDLPMDVIRFAIADRDYRHAEIILAELSRVFFDTVQNALLDWFDAMKPEHSRTRQGRES